MIKRIRFVTRRIGMSLAEFAERWPRPELEAPIGVRPLRAVVCTALHEVSEAPHDGIGIEWFANERALRRHEEWLGARQPSVVEPGATVVVIAEEWIMRGADWLVRRWSNPAPKLKHMALARRAEGLSASEFSERWRNRPGKIGAGIIIPEQARGNAYVQNHPLPGAAWGYDAINEVYFDDLESMQRRIDFFREQDVGNADAELVSEATFIAVREHIVPEGEQS